MHGQTLFRKGAIVAQCHLVKQSLINKGLINVWKLNLYKEYITLANSKCFTIKQLFGGAGA